MSIDRIDIENVRNIQKVSIQPSSQINLIFGKNASGKSSFLEAVYILALGRSFRTHQIQNVIQTGADSLTVFARFITGQNSSTKLGIERGVNVTRLRINGNSVNSVAELARHIPVQLITPDSHQLIENSPQGRRKFMDWGMFHVEHDFFSVWSRFNRAVKQRNAGLRSGVRNSEIKIWHTEMVECANYIDEVRKTYVTELNEVTLRYVADLMGPINMDIRYLQGWRANENYHEHLERSIHSDREAGYTRHGPHRADLDITVDGIPARKHISRGEQKLLASALRLAQVELLTIKTGKSCVLLIDDLPSELDNDHRSMYLDSLCGLGCQIFITATEKELLDDRKEFIGKTFHVEHGDIVEVLQ